MARLWTPAPPRCVTSQTSSVPSERRLYFEACPACSSTLSPAVCRLKAWCWQRDPFLQQGTVVPLSLACTCCLVLFTGCDMNCLFSCALCLCGLCVHRFVTCITRYAGPPAPPTGIKAAVAPPSDGKSRPRDASGFVEYSDLTGVPSVSLDAAEVACESSVKDFIGKIMVGYFAGGGGGGDFSSFYDYCSFITQNSCLFLLS
jgi:hypothetical protein